MEQTLKTCYECGREGRLSYTCPENAALPRGSRLAGTGPGPETKKCYKRSGVGHIARDCPKETECYNCREMGHISRECPHPQKCHHCGKEGHEARICPDILDFSRKFLEMSLPIRMTSFRAQPHAKMEEQRR
ncbi:hypothetical protein MVEN_00286600 [Mycena venus]|uniref:CCHC-type domain-containing protein n=1 Tax=Mycena venus TaxID=2733690 RepID=A0A8H7DBP3_9AGAR|nr:hypothetical protein MVEN_00286600 [Mycena venus]